MTENYKTLGQLVLVDPIDDEVVTKSGIVLPEHERTSIPIRGKVLAAPIKCMKEGLLPGDVILYTAQTREKIAIEFQPKIESKCIVAVPPECIVAYLPASLEKRKVAVKNLRKYYDDAFLAFMQMFGGVEDVSVQNIWKYS